MKNKIIPWLQYCLECGNKNKKIKKVFIDRDKYNKKLKSYIDTNPLFLPKDSRKFYHKHYECTKCNNKISFLTCTMYDHKNYYGEIYFKNFIFGDFVYTNFYENCKRYLYSYRLDKKYFPKNEVEAFKIIQKLISNSIFQ